MPDTPMPDTPMPEAVVIRPPVEIDPATAAALDEQLTAVEPSGSTVVDFGSVTFCDSSGIRVLILHATRHRDAGGVFRTVAVSPVVQRVFDLAGVGELIGAEPAS